MKTIPYPLRFNFNSGSERSLINQLWNAPIGRSYSTSTVNYGPLPVIQSVIPFFKKWLKSRNSEPFFREIRRREVQKEKKLFTKDFAKAFRLFRKWISSKCVPELKNSPLFISSKDLFISIKFHSISSDCDLTGSAGNGSILIFFKNRPILISRLEEYRRTFTGFNPFV